MRVISFLHFAVLLFVWAPVYLCFRLEELKVDNASNLHFRQVGSIAGTMGMAHIAMTMNITRHMTLLRRFCAMPKTLTTGRKLSSGTSRLLKDLGAHCSNMGDAVLEREALWLNRFNLGYVTGGANRKTRAVEFNWSPVENPMVFSCKPRTKRQLIVLGIAAVGALVAVGSTLFTQIQLSRMSSRMHASQEVNIKVLQEHQVTTILILVRENT